MCDLTFGDLPDWNIMKYRVRCLCQGACLFTHAAYKWTRGHFTNHAKIVFARKCDTSFGKSNPYISMCLATGQVSQLTTTLRHCQKYEPCFLATLRSSHRHAKENNMHSNSIVVNCTDQHLLHLPSGFEHSRAELQDMISDGIVQKTCLQLSKTHKAECPSHLCLSAFTPWFSSQYKLSLAKLQTRPLLVVVSCFLSIVILSSFFFKRNNCFRWSCLLHYASLVRQAGLFTPTHTGLFKHTAYTWF